MRSQLLVPLIIFGVLVSCATPPAAVVTPEPMTAARYLEEGRKFLTLPTDLNFVHLLNAYQGKFEEETRLLLEAYEKKQRTLINHYKENGDLFKLRFCYNNVAAVRPIGVNEERDFYNAFVTLLRRQNYAATARYFEEEYKLSGSGNRTRPVFDSIIGYNRILAEIQVMIEYADDELIQRIKRPSGTGFLIDSRHVLTAYHVVEGIFALDTTRATVSLYVQNQRFEDVTVVAWDSLTDLALLELDRTLPVPFDSPDQLFGDSAALTQGAAMYCLGNHNGLVSTLTKGIVSSTDRKAPEVGSWIQVDAAVTPGASGGLMIGEDGKVYGMLVAGFLYEDINFVVPSSIILEVIDRLREKKRVLRPWLGLLCREDPSGSGPVSYTHLTLPTKRIV